MQTADCNGMQEEGRAPDFMVELVFTETPGMAMAAARACCMMV